MLVKQLTEAILLGVLQGVTEFLPVSSSAHLILIPWLLGWQPRGIMFDMILHGGSLLALLVYFRRPWRQLLNQFLKRTTYWKVQSIGPTRLFQALLLGTVPALLVAGFFRQIVEKQLRQPMVIAMTLSVFGLLLGWADRNGRRSRCLDSIGISDGLMVGLAQAFALVPGVSRSGVTVTAGLILGFNRADAARFSFLLATPLIALGAVGELYEWWWLQPSKVDSDLILGFGVIFSFLSAFLCIKYFLRFLVSGTYIPFVIYRFLLAALIFYLLAF